MMEMDYLEEYKKVFAESKSDDEMSDWSSDEDDDEGIQKKSSESEFLKQDTSKVEPFYSSFGNETKQEENYQKENYNYLFDDDDNYEFESFTPAIIANEELFYTLNFDPNNLITDRVPFTHFPHQNLFEHYTIYKISQTPPLGNFRVVSPCNYMIKQQDLIREIFSMLRGDEGCVFKMNSNGQFECKQPTLSISCFTRTSLHNILKFYINIANNLEQLSAKARRNIQSVKSIILQSYYSTLLTIVLEIRNSLSELEKQNQLGSLPNVKTLSLLSLRSLMFRSESQVNILTNLDAEVDYFIDTAMAQSDGISDIISNLFEKVAHRQYTLCTDIQNDEFDFSYLLLMSLLKPYLKIMDSWIFEGIIHDRYQEFMLHRNEMLNIETPYFWSEGFVQSKIPSIFSEIKDKIINIGKSIIIVKDLELQHEIDVNTGSISEFALDKEIPSLFDLVTQTIKSGLPNICNTFSNTDFPLAVLRTPQKKKFEDNFRDKAFSPLTPISPENAPVGSIHFMRSPPKKKRMLSLVETEDLYSNKIADSDEKSDLVSFFSLEDSPMDRKNSNVYNMFKKKSLFEVIDFQNAEFCQNSQHFHQPLEVIFDMGIVAHITEQYSKVSPYLCNLIVYRCKLIDYLTALRAIFLMEAGDIMDYFATHLFHLSDRFFTFDFRGITTFDIQIILRDTLRLGTEFPRRYSFATNNSTSVYTTDVFSSIKLEELISVTFDETKLKLEEGNFFDAISFNFDLEWPLNSIITKEHIQNYSDVLIFNLKLKQAKQILDVLSLKTDAFVHRGNSYLKFYSFLNQLKHFIGTVQYYMMNRILHALWNELCDNILASQSLDDLIKYHQEYVNKIKDRFLLKKAQFVKNHILKVVHLCIKLRTKLNNFRQTQREDIFLPELEEMETEFRKSFKMLITIINSILTRGTHEHLEDLRTRLIFNNYYH